MNFTRLSHKTSYISLSKIVYIYIFVTVTIHIYMIIIDVYPILLLISHLAPFFPSLLHQQNQLRLIIFFFP